MSTDPVPKHYKPEMLHTGNGTKSFKKGRRNNVSHDTRQSCSIFSPENALRANKRISQPLTSMEFWKILAGRVIKQDILFWREMQRGSVISRRRVGSTYTRNR